MGVPPAAGAWPAMGDDDSKRSDYLVDRVCRAPGPEEAADAYIQARLRLGSDDKRLNDAYVRKMVDRDKDNALGNAVLAWHLAREQQMAAAFKHMERAVDKDDDHPFIQDLGGQFMAWYDVMRKFENLPEKIDDAAEEIKDELEDKRIYKKSYQAARAGLLAQRAVVVWPAPIPGPTYRVPPPPPAPQYVPVPVPQPRYVPAPRYVPVPEPRHDRGSIIVPGLRFIFSWGGRGARRG